MSVARPIVVAGAGSIGCFVGGMLAAAGRRVRLLARPRTVDALVSAGLRLTSFEGLDRHLPVSEIDPSSDATILGDAAIVLVCVKSMDTDAIGATIAAHVPGDAIIVSLQNGVANVAALQRHLPSHRVLAGMVPFNVVAVGNAHVHRSTSGDIILQRDDAFTAEGLSVPGLMLKPSDDIVGIQWGKLLLNLINALNALSGLPLREQLSQRRWRLLLADQMSEALKTMQAVGITPKSTTPLPLSWAPRVMRLPNWAFKAIAGSMVKIDPKARLSMWEDLQRGRRTEIDYLQGAIIGLAERHGMSVPLSRQIVALVKAAEARGQGSPGLTVKQVRDAMKVMKEE